MNVSRKFALILVLLAMLPQLVLGMGSGRVLEICFCGLLGSHESPVIGHCHDHDAGHTHHHHSSGSCDHREEAEDHHAAPCECASDDAGECHSCDHLILTGQFGRFEPVQTWNYFAILDALACVCVETITIAESPVWRVPPRDVKPPGDILYTTRTTSFQI